MSDTSIRVLASRAAEFRPDVDYAGIDDGTDIAQSVFDGAKREVRLGPIACRPGRHTRFDDAWERRKEGGSITRYEGRKQPLRGVNATGPQCARVALSRRRKRCKIRGERLYGIKTEIAGTPGPSGLEKGLPSRLPEEFHG